MSTIEVLKGCPFRPRVSTMAVQCCDQPGCPGRKEIFFEPDAALDEAVQGCVRNQVLAFDGWINIITQLPGGGVRTHWLCPACAVEMVDLKDQAVVEAYGVQASLARTVVVFRPRANWTAPSA